VSQAVVVLKGTPSATATTVADLKAYTLGAQVDTTSYTAAKDQIQPDQAPRVYDNQNDVAAALKGKQVDAVVVDLPTAFYVTAAQVPNSVVIGQLPPPDGTKERFGLVMAKNSPVTACVNAAVTALDTNGTLTALQNRWVAKNADVPVLQ
jgi:polar amino acid transport system substrate-binding protein